MELSDHHPRGRAFHSSYGEVLVLDAIHEIDPVSWQNAFARHCKDARFYQIAEETLNSQFEQHYFVLKNEATGETAVQPFFFVDQDIALGLPLLARKAIARLRGALPRFLKMKLLMVGCVAGEGQLGCTEAWAVNALHEVLQNYARAAGASMIVLKDFPAHYRRDLVTFSSNGYRRIPSMPGAKLDLEFGSFEEYMQRRLGRVFRKNLRRKFKKLREKPEIKMEVQTDISDIIDEVFPLYRQTFERSALHFEQLTPEFLSRLGKEMPDRVRFFLWRQSGRLIAFNVCMVHDGVLYDLDLGMDYSVALDLHMYFVTWRDIIRWAIENGIRMYHTGPLNYDPKLHLRLDLAPQDLYARHTSDFLNPVFRLAFNYLQPARHDPVIKKFRNAEEL